MTTLTYRIAYTESKSSRWKNEYRSSFEAALAFGRSKFQALVYNDTTGALVANLTAAPTTGYPSYVQGLRNR